MIQQRLRVDGETLSLGSEQIPLDGFTEVVLIGRGKASLKMGCAVENLLGHRVKRGLLITDRRSSVSVRSEVVVGGHPLPDANSLIAGKRLVELVRSCGDGALIIFLISGGGSALVELPVSRSISLEDLRVTNQVLIGCGATIREINGIGGRNQEFVLYSAARLGALGIREGAAVLSCGTDGIDGNSNAAGAVADVEQVIKAARHTIDASIFISGNDSHSFFKEAGGLVVTGPSGNNVRDLRILMAQ